MSIMNVALSGLQAASSDLEVTGNNIANANTIGFKQSKTEFADVYYGGGIGNQVGNGVKVASISADFSSGQIGVTNGEFDMALAGDGFFTVKGTDGSTAYTRAGNFQVDKEGYITASNGAHLQGYLANKGQITAAMGDIQLPLSQALPNPTTMINYNRNFDASAPVISSAFNANDSTTFNFADQSTIYDSLGTAHAASTFYTKTSNNNWNVNVEIDGALVSSGTLAFSDAGVLQSSTGLNAVSWNPGGGAQAGQPLNFNYSSTTQYGGNNAPPSVTQDGYAAGIYTGVSIDNNGIISARYTNGRLEPLAQVAVARFSNPQGLLAAGDREWLETTASGVPQLNLNNSFGNIRSNSLESSNVDLTEQLVKMITTQRAFQANAQSVKAGDSITQTIINIQ